MDLENLIEQYIGERVEFYRIGVPRTARLYSVLVGQVAPGGMPVGFVRFLQAVGVTTPSTTHVSAYWIGRYWEYLTQNVGVLCAAQAMKALRGFWRWCLSNEYIPEQPMPPDLKTTAPFRSTFRVEVSIHESKTKRSRS